MEVFMKQIIDGNKAVSNIAYLFSEVASIYPITPSSPMASNVDYLSHTDHYNLYHDKVNVVEMQSEAGAAGAMHGALITGSLATTFTASQGLLLMLPNMYKMAGEMLPGVIHVASRTVATHALSIFGDHSDVYATRGTGFCMLSSSSVFDAQNLAAVAHLSAMKSSLPFLHFFDGFRTSHELNTILSIDEEELLKLVPWESVEAFKNRALNVSCMKQRGMAENEDIYFQSLEAKNRDYEEVSDTVNYYMEKINHLMGTHYAPFAYYGDKDASDIIVAMGSVCDTIRLVIDEERKKGKKYGLVEVHLYRPFSVKYLLSVLPSSVKRIAVLDRTKESGSIGEPLYLDMVSALKDQDIVIVGGRYGLSSKNTTPAQIKAVYDMLETNPKHNFTIGIHDDVTNTSLKIPDYHIDLDDLEVKIFGFGSDGMVGASKDILHIVGEHSDSFVQGYFEYDSKKSGGVTVSHLRISKNEIRAPFYVTNPNVYVVTKAEYFDSFDILDGVRERATLLVNTNDDVALMSKFKHSDLELIKSKKMRIMTIDAERVALKHQLKGKINKIMEVIILSLLGFDKAIDLVSETIRVEFATKGEDIVKQNIAAIQSVFEEIHTLEIGEGKSQEEVLKNFNLFERIERRLGNEITVSEIAPFRDGTFPSGLSKLEKRKVASKVVKWKSEHCIQCGMCSLVCPHAVIRPFLVKDEEGIPALGAGDYHYLISISEADCTSCGLCINICPGKNGEKALEFGDYSKEKQEQADHYFESYENPNMEPLFTIKNSQLRKPRFEFSGACAGCGETAYIKLLTQLYQDKLVIANATGCSSIYGGSVPSTPYTLPWANSLFEDNAEFAYGMHLSFKQKRQRIYAIMKETYNQVSSDVKEVFDEFFEHFNDYAKTLEVKELLKEKDIPASLKELIDYIPARTVWAFGGDGWAYDIGFGGIDHVLSSNENVKILVLDTEVYSNTGGQMSKSSHQGQVAEFADFGKRVPKKDLFRIAMSYPNCYVASVSLGANMMHTLKVFKEAEEHVGPSIILAYAPCIEHGIKGGMSCSTLEQKLAVDVGYSLLMRYQPTEKKLYLDSKEPNFERYDEFLNNEVRYRALKIKDASCAEVLLQENKEHAIARYQYYLKLSQEN
ncbi:MAG: pyruvate:ferredoxin (flavodoxin) oxidoreductase [Bacilli bacterium]|nr:pyruvate:ferredoxin (flavodoxin) oxidoreductase [Bacilli bacterium]